MAGPKAYSLKLSRTAEAAYSKIVKAAQPHIQAGASGHPAVKLLRIVDECLNKIIPHNPYSPDRALSGDLSNIFRVKKGRVRICYIASSIRYEIYILYISESLRKAGDKHDPYVVFSGLLASGQFDELFDLLGVKRPPR